jgi:hypothetical protein
LENILCHSYFFLCRVTFSDCSDSRTKHATDAVREKQCNFNFQIGGTYSNHCVLKVNNVLEVTPNDLCLNIIEVRE